MRLKINSNDDQNNFAQFVFMLLDRQLIKLNENNCFQFEGKKGPAETKENIRNYLLELTEFERDLVKQKKRER